MTSIVLLLLVVSNPAAERSFQISVQAGPIAPGDWMVQGDQWVEYDALTGFGYPVVRGFGNGVDLVLNGEYYFSDWGLMLDAGVRLHTQRKVGVNTLQGRHYFENRLIIVPISFSIIHKIEMKGSRVIPILGFGPDIYFSRWETKDYRYYTYLFYRDWYKGDNLSFGAHFFAGLDFNIYYPSFFVKTQCRYTFVRSNWELDDQDSDNKTKIDDLNIGGTSLRFGIGYSF